jgi:chemotaxis signal transduction protein
MEAARSDAAEAGTIAPAAPQWVIFVCSGTCLAIELERVQEILTPRPFTRLPGAGAAAAGLVAVRSRIITTYDLGLALGLSAAATCPDHRILLVEDGVRVTGLVVDEVLAVAPLLEEGAPSAAGVALARAASTWDRRRVALLDVGRVLERLLN